jgi:hypothetical protein
VLNNMFQYIAKKTAKAAERFVAAPVGVVYGAITGPITFNMWAIKGDYENKDVGGVSFACKTVGLAPIRLVVGSVYGACRGFMRGAMHGLPSLITLPKDMATTQQEALAAIKNSNRLQLRTAVRNYYRATAVVSLSSTQIADSCYRRDPANYFDSGVDDAKCLTHNIENNTGANGANAEEYADLTDLCCPR